MWERRVEFKEGMEPNVGSDSECGSGESAVSGELDERDADVVCDFGGPEGWSGGDAW